MTDLSAEYKALAEYRPKHKVRFVTAASLFDGHDAAINIMRRILQGMGAEVIHLGHNRSVDEVVTAALQEDAQGIAISSYQGGHVEYFKYMVELLRQRGGAHIKVFGGGGGVIVPAEIQELQASGVTRIYSPEDGQRMGLAGMIGEMLMMSDVDLSVHAPKSLAAIRGTGARRRALAQLITALENGQVASSAEGRTAGRCQAQARTPVRRHHRHRRRRQEQPDRRTDPPAAPGPGRSPADRRHQHRPEPAQERRRAARRPHPHERHRPVARRHGRRRRHARVHAQPGHPRLRQEISQALPDVLCACKCAGFDLIVVETSGIGQGDAAIVPLVDVPMYVMTPEFGAASQLEKIDMLDFAEFVAINKFDRKGALDALRDVAKQVQRNREAFKQPPEAMPVFGTMASRFNDDGVTALYQALKPRLAALGLKLGEGTLAAGGHPAQHPPGADRSRRTGALPGRHRRHRARLQAACARAGPPGARTAAAQGQRSHAADRQARTPPRGGSGARPGAIARSAAGRPLDASCWRCGRTCKRPTPATNTS